MGEKAELDLEEEDEREWPVSVGAKVAVGNPDIGEDTGEEKGVVKGLPEVTEGKTIRVGAVGSLSIIISSVIKRPLIQILNALSGSEEVKAFRKD